MGEPERPQSRPRTLRDQRSDGSTIPPPQEEAPLARVFSRAATEPATGRITALQAEIARLQAERASDADQTAEMLVRIAAAERAKAEALATLEVMSQHAELAEKSAVNASAALERARADMEVDRTQVVELEAKLAHTATERGEAIEAIRREHLRDVAALEARHAEALATMRDAHVRALEEERSAAARARQQAAGAEVRLANARTAMAATGELLDELHRREEMAAGLRNRTIEQARRALAGDGAAMTAPPPPTRPSDGPSVEVTSLELDWEPSD
jgi:hypothetical protein